MKYHIPGSTNYLTNLKERSQSGTSPESSAGGAQSAVAGASLEGGSPGAGTGADPSRAPRPFPLNQSFISESILSEELRNEIYERVTAQKKSVREVSVELGVDMKRVAAVVRLVELEKRCKSQVCSFFFF